MERTADLITVDGSLGEGGGQVLRSSASLSAITGRPVRIVNVRANRQKPGLRPQHRMALLAAARVSGAVVQGDAIGSTDVTFWPGDPGNLQGGQYTFDIGTAGSTGLVCQTVLPILLRATGRSQVTVIGGTHNPFAPPFHFLRHSFQSALRRMGYDVGFEMIRPGFYPAGGGKLVMHVDPVSRQRLHELDWMERGRLVSLRCEVLSALLPDHVARREMKILRDLLKSAGWPLPGVMVRDIHDAAGPGNAICIRAIYDAADEVFTALGERGKPAERVAYEAADAAIKWLTAGVPVGPYLADQLLIPMALAKGGRFTTMSPLDAHVATNAAVVSQIMGAQTRFTDHGDRVMVEVDIPQ